MPLYYVQSLPQKVCLRHYKMITSIPKSYTKSPLKQMSVHISPSVVSMLRSNHFIHSPTRVNVISPVHGLELYTYTWFPCWDQIILFTALQELMWSHQNHSRYSYFFISRKAFLLRNLSKITSMNSTHYPFEHVYVVSGNNTSCPFQYNINITNEISL